MVLVRGPGVEVPDAGGERQQHGEQEARSDREVAEAEPGGSAPGAGAPPVAGTAAGLAAAAGLRSGGRDRLRRAAALPAWPRERPRLSAAGCGCGFGAAGRDRLDGPERRRAGRGSVGALLIGTCGNACLPRRRRGLSSCSGRGLLLAPGESKPVNDRRPGRCRASAMVTQMQASPSPARPRPPVPLQWLRVLFALVVREMATKFGRSWGGYLWAIAEPLGGILLLTARLQLRLPQAAARHQLRAVLRHRHHPLLPVQHRDRLGRPGDRTQPGAAHLPGGEPARRGARQVRDRLRDDVRSSACCSTPASSSTTTCR